MIGFLKRILGKESINESGTVDFNSWIIEDYLELNRIPDRRVDGQLEKVPAQECFAEYAEYETTTGHAYAPSFQYEDLNVLFYPLFMVVENRSTTPEACFIVIRPNLSSRPHIKMELQKVSLIAEANSESFILALYEFIGSKMDEIEKRFR